MQEKGKTIPVVLWLLSGILLIIAMVIIGGITRLTGSGLSIVEWNLISGTLPPLTEAEWMLTFEKYKQFPEYQKLNFSMTLAGFKNIFWWEYLHRLLGRLIGLVFIVPFVYFLLRRQLSPWLIRRLVFIMVLGMAQGLMGWIMVKSGLNEMPHVSHYRLAAHLTLALLLIGVILWTVADLVMPVQEKPAGHRLFRSLAWLLVGAILLQILLGAFVAGLKSGFSYNTWPLMQGEFFPSAFSGDITWHNVFDHGVAVQFIHRWFAFVVLIGIALYWVYLPKHAASGTLRTLAGLLLAVALLQVGLGIATLVLIIPITLGVLHQLVAVLLFMVALLVAHQATYQKLTRARPLRSVPEGFKV